MTSQNSGFTLINDKFDNMLLNIDPCFKHLNMLSNHCTRKCGFVDIYTLKIPKTG